jgi:ribosome-associated heat shock protein Hsp15
MDYKPQLTFEIGLETVAYNAEPTEDKVLRVRLDKWLWAARFFKTRALARAAIENGRVDYNGQKIIPSREIEIGSTITINTGQGRRTVVIKGLSTRRRSTEEARSLYEELEASEGSEDKDEYAPISTEVKARKTVRFLRRSMNIVDSSSSY